MRRTDNPNTGRLSNMNPLSESPNNGHRLEFLRWLCVLPAAMLGGIAGYYIGGLVSRLAIYGWGTATESSFVYYLSLAMLYMPKKALFVIAGAITAPRHRRTTALILAGIAILLSLAVHVLAQSNVGLANYTHLAAESVGAVLGVGYMWYSALRRRTGNG